MKKDDVYYCDVCEEELTDDEVAEGYTVCDRCWAAVMCIAATKEEE